jgi:hypothetical protein
VMLRCLFGVRVEWDDGTVYMHERGVLVFGF